MRLCQHPRSFTFLPLPPNSSGVAGYGFNVLSTTTTRIRIDQRDSFLGQPCCQCGHSQPCHISRHLGTCVARWKSTWSGRHEHSSLVSCPTLEPCPRHDFQVCFIGAFFLIPAVSEKFVKKSLTLDFDKEIVDGSPSIEEVGRGHERILIFITQTVAWKLSERQEVLQIMSGGSTPHTDTWIVLFDDSDSSLHHNRGLW